jgi:hypothetical protein
METNTNTVRSVPRAIALEHLSDAELLAGTRHLVGRSNQLLAELLAHLGEVEARGIHRTRACSSLYTYCIYELRFSEDEAFRRVAAARLVRRFPALLDALASGELHLTGLLLVGPHLTAGNLVEVLAPRQAPHQARDCAPGSHPRPLAGRSCPHRAARTRASAGVTSEPSWEEFVEATCPVRDLAPGDRPRDWMRSDSMRSDWIHDPDDPVPTADDEKETAPMVGAIAAPARVGGSVHEALAPERYKVQLTATEEYVRLVEEAKALLSYAVPKLTLEELQLRALRAFVAELAKKKYATLDSAPANDARVENPRRRGRHVPAAVRRAVVERDGKQCSYVDATGKRCPETHRLEFHHVTPFAAGGEHTASNLALRCTAHNALAAEQDFGRAFMEGKKA